MRFLYLTALILLVGISVIAQEDEEETPITGDWETTENTVFNSDCFGSVRSTSVADDPERYAVYTLVMSEDEQYILIIEGVDLLYTLQDDGTYSGAVLEETDAYTYSGTLSFTDDGLIQLVTETRTSETCVYNNEIELARLEGDASTLWMESEREFTDVSFFGPCLGRSDATPGDAWVNPDPLIPLQFEEDRIVSGTEEYLAAGDMVFINELELSAGQSSTYRSETLTLVDEALITNEVFFQLDGRDDCVAAYNSTFTPAEIDFEAWITDDEEE